MEVSPLSVVCNLTSWGMGGVGGFDARSKLKILMRLAYGIDVDEEEIGCRGLPN